MALLASALEIKLDNNSRLVSAALSLFLGLAGLCLRGVPRVERDVNARPGVQQNLPLALIYLNITETSDNLISYQTPALATVGTSCFELSFSRFI